jgi:hypothetical protein
MFKFNFRESFPCSAKEIFERTMYNFDEYEKFSPDVTKVEVLSRVMRPDGREDISVRVFAKAIMPAPVRALLGMNDTMDWQEFYTSDLSKLTVDWRVDPPMFQKYVECSGTSWCEDCASGCRIVITGAMTIRLMPIKGIPPPVVQATINMLEPFIGNMVSFNLKKYFKCVRSCIEKEMTAAKR